MGRMFGTKCKINVMGFMKQKCVFFLNVLLNNLLINGIITRFFFTFYGNIFFMGKTNNDIFMRINFITDD